MHHRGDVAGEAERSRVRNWSDALSGRTLRFSFHEGPAEGACHDHTFHGDETVTWHAHDRPARYRSFQVADEVYVVSYLTKAGYTLTVALNFETDELYGFSSNDEHWYPVRGSFEIVG